MSNRSLDSKYAKWAKEVKERFGWRCALCGSRDGVVEKDYSVKTEGDLAV